MFFGSIKNWTSVTNTAIPFTTVLNTNNKTSNTNGVISMRSSGYYDIDASLTISGVVGTVTATVYADGVATNVTASKTLVSGDTAIISIVDAVKVSPAIYPNTATISIVLDTADVTVNGNLRVQYIQ